MAVASYQRCAPLIFATSLSWKCPEQNVIALHFYGIGYVALLGLEGNWLLSSLVAREKTSPSKCDISLNRSGGYQCSAFVPLSKLVGRDVQIRLLTCADNSHPKPYLVDVQGTPVAVASNRPCAPLIFVTSQAWKCPEQNVIALHFYRIGEAPLLRLKGNLLLSLLSSLVARQKTSPSKCDVSLNRSGGFQLGASVPLSNLVGRNVQIPLLICADNSHPKPYFDVQGTPVAVASNRPCAPLIFVTSQSWKCPEQNVVDLHLNNGIGGVTLLRLEGNLLSLLSSLVAREKTSPSKCDISLNRSGGHQHSAFVPFSKLVGRDVQIPLLTVADSSNPNPFFDMQGTRVAVASNRRCVPLIFVSPQSWKCPKQNVVDLQLNRIGYVALLGLAGKLLLSSLVAREKTSPSKCDVSLNRSGGYQRSAFVPLSKLVGKDVQMRLLTCADNSHPKPYLVDVQGTPVAVASNGPCAPLIFVTSQSWKCPEQNVIALHFYRIGEAPLLRLKGNLLLSLLSSLVARQKTSPSKCDVSLNGSGGFQLGASVPLSKLVGRDVQIPLLTCADNSDLKPYLDMQGTPVAVASNRPCAPLIFVSPQSWKCPEQHVVGLHFYGIGDVALLGLEGNLLLSSLVARGKTSPSKCDISLNQSGGYQLGVPFPLSKLVGRDVQIPLLTCADNSHPKPYLVDVQGTPVAVASNRPCAPLIFVSPQSWKCPEQNSVSLHFYGIGYVALLGLKGNVLLSSLVARQKTSPSKCDVSLNRSGGYQLGVPFPLSKLVGRDVRIRLLTCADNSDPKPYFDVQGTPVAVASNRRRVPLIIVTSQSWICSEQNVIALHLKLVGEAPLLRLKGNLLLSLLSSLVAREKTSPSKCDISLNRSGGYQLGASVPLSNLVGRDVQIRLLTCADNSHPKPFFDVQGNTCGSCKQSTVCSTDLCNFSILEMSRAEFRWFAFLRNRIRGFAWTRGELAVLQPCCKREDISNQV